VFGERVWTDRPKVVMAQIAMAWFLDRMVLLFEDMKARDPDDASWEY
jgi:hypothetical protein